MGPGHRLRQAATPLSYAPCPCCHNVTHCSVIIVGAIVGVVLYKRFQAQKQAEEEQVGVSPYSWLHVPLGRTPVQTP